MEAKVTLWKENVSRRTPVIEAHLGLEAVFELIETDERIASVCERIRAESSKKERTRLKTELLPYITVCGEYLQAVRRKEHISTYNYVVCLDYDDLTEDVELVKSKLAQNPYVWAVFISPSGNGLKVFVRVRPDQPIAETPESWVHFHETQAWVQVENYFSQYFGTSDDKNKDITRNCFLSHDPKIYVNRDAEVFEVFAPPKVVHPTLPPPAPAKTGKRKGDTSKQPDQVNYGSTVVRVKQIYEYLKATGQSITETHDNWNRVGIALFRSLDVQTASYWFVAFSLLDKDHETIEALQARCAYYVGYVNGDGKQEDRKTNFGTIVHLAKAKGFAVPKGNPLNFWRTVESADGRKKAVIDKDRFITFLAELGFRKWFFNNNDCQFIRIKDNIVETVSRARIQAIVTHYVKTEVTSSLVWGAICRQGSELYNEILLQELPEDPLSTVKEDKRNIGHIYYRNGFVRIAVTETVDEFIPGEPRSVRTAKREFLPYDQLDGLVWRSQILDRDFVEIGDNEKHFYGKKNEFSHFVYTIAGNNPRQGKEASKVGLERLTAFETALGYLIHSYKNMGMAKAIILTDETDSVNPNEANGRTGKGLFFKAVEMMVKTETLKNFDGKSQFNFQKYTSDLKVWFYSDVPKKFDFFGLFPYITDPFEVEAKNKPSYSVPFSRSPKFCIATNFVIAGEGGSYEGRQFILEVAPFFEPSFTPLNYFGHLLFEDWDERQWHLFDNYVVHCLELFLIKGLADYPKINTETRKARQICGQEFLDWAECSLSIGHTDSLRGYIVRYTTTVGKYHNMTEENMKKRLVAFCKMNGWELEQQPRRTDPLTGRKLTREYKIIDPKQK